MIINSLNKSFDGIQVLKNINLNINDHEFFSILGPSGCGKTTLLKIIAGLVNNYDGSILYNENILDNIPTEKRNIGMVFQEPLLFPNMNVIDNICFGLKMKKVSKKNRYNIGKILLKEVQLDGFENRKINELSGGQKQRVAIARALSVEPDLLLMDEPFSALDYEIRHSMQVLIKSIHEKHYATIIFVTHNKDEAFFLSERLAIIKDSEIKQIGTPYDLHTKPNSKEIALFLGKVNIYEGFLENNTFYNDNFKLYINTEIENKTKVTIQINPENLIISKDYKSNYFIDGVIEDIIIKNEFINYKIKIKNDFIISNNIKGSTESLKKYQKVFVNYSPSIINIIEKELNET